MSENIQMTINFGGLLQAIGAGTAMGRTVAKSDKYMDYLNSVAIGSNADYFNKIVAPTVAATGKIKHMYEWGTIGVNPARSGPRMQPTNPAARLWKITIGGYGFNKEVGYVFKPSVTKRPLPTSGETGMSQEVIRKMKQRVWTWKAQTMEEGGMVHIARRTAWNRKKRAFLLIPNWEGTDTTYWRKSDIKRGYILLQYPVSMHVGRGTRGQFEAVFDAYWLSGESNEKMDNTIQKQIEQDFFPFLKASKGSSLEIGAVEKLNVATKIEQAAKYVEQVALRNAKQRAQTFEAASEE